MCFPLSRRFKRKSRKDRRRRSEPPLPPAIRHPHREIFEQRPQQTRPNSPVGIQLTSYPTIPNPNAGQVTTGSAMPEADHSTSVNEQILGQMGPNYMSDQVAIPSTIFNAEAEDRRPRTPTRPPTRVTLTGRDRPVSAFSWDSDSATDSNDRDANINRAAEEADAKDAISQRRELSDRDMLSSERRYREAQGH